MSKYFDAIVVGRGIAGAVLSEVLLARGLDVLIIDDHGKGSSSQVAAGLYNPLVLKRHILSWKANTVLPIALNFYADLEKQYGGEFLIKKELAKLFTSEQEVNVWKERMLDPEEASLMRLGEEELPEPIFAPFSHGVVTECGWLDVKVFLEAHKERWLDVGRLIETEVRNEGIILQGNAARIGDHTSKLIILCQGHRALSDPWFGGKGFNVVKGEVLDLRIEGLELNKIISKGFFLMPLGGNNYRAGSNFVWDFSDDQPTTEGREEILQKVRSVLIDGTSIEVLDHQAGIRPATKDRRPILGRHPDHQQLAIFNGLGARGVMYAPWCAQHLAEHLLEGTTLDPEMDASRFLSNQAAS